MKNIIQKILGILSKKIIQKYQPDIIGITGSVGKSSTKEAVYLILKKDFRVRRNIKNYNNEIGVPLTIIGEKSANKSFFGWVKIILKALKLICFTDSTYPEILILEMGADHPGDLEYLTKIAPCDIGVITNISESHLEFFGTLAKISEEKAEIIKHLKKSGYAILNCDNDLIKKIKPKTKAKTLCFGFDKNNDIRGVEPMINYDKGRLKGLVFKLSYKGNILPIFLPNLLNYKQIYSVLTAIAIADIYNLKLFNVVKSLKNFTPPNGRMKLIRGIKQSLIIDDTYNSSPESLLSALDVMKDIELGGGKKILVLGDMLELGVNTRKIHFDVGKKIAKNKFDLLITKGEASKEIARGAIKGGMSEKKVFSFSRNNEAGRFLQEKIKKNDLILIKGSQGMRMEKIVKEVMAYPLKAKELLVRQDKNWQK